MTAERGATGREDFEAFYRAHLAELVALAHALAGPDEAYDLAQETLLAASRRWRQVGELAQPDAWARDACAARATSGWKGRSAARVALVGLATLWFNVVGINFFFGSGSQHSYAAPEQITVVRTL